MKSLSKFRFFQRHLGKAPVCPIHNMQDLMIQSQIIQSLYTHSDESAQHLTQIKISQAAFSLSKNEQEHFMHLHRYRQENGQISYKIPPNADVYTIQESKKIDIIERLHQVACDLRIQARLDEIPDFKLDGRSDGFDSYPRRFNLLPFLFKQTLSSEQIRLMWHIAKNGYLKQFEKAHLSTIAWRVYNGYRTCSFTDKRVTIDHPEAIKVLEYIDSFPALDFIFDSEYGQPLSDIWSVVIDMKKRLSGKLFDSVFPDMEDFNKMINSDIINVLFTYAPTDKQIQHLAHEVAYNRMRPPERACMESLWLAMKNHEIQCQFPTGEYFRIHHPRIIDCIKKASRTQAYIDKHQIDLDKVTNNNSLSNKC